MGASTFALISSFAASARRTKAYSSSGGIFAVRRALSEGGEAAPVSQGTSAMSWKRSGARSSSAMEKKGFSRQASRTRKEQGMPTQFSRQSPVPQAWFSTPITAS